MRELSAPPSIELRIRTAMMDDHPYQVVAYSRGEGTTTVILELAKRNRDIVIIGNDYVRRQCKEENVPFIHEASDPDVLMRSITLIADAVNEKYLKGWFEQSRKGNRLVVLKGIQIDRDETIYVQGRKMVIEDRRREAAPYFDEHKFNSYNGQFVNRSE